MARWFIWYAPTPQLATQSPSRGRGTGQHLSDAAELELRSRASILALDRLLSLVEVPRLRASAGELERRIHEKIGPRGGPCRGITEFGEKWKITFI